ncbi:MAG: hypothetical protein LBN29_12415 [Mediterranea sp.]|jgi:RHS repeat-associated protein|nr:hypothetical protein [Mediterranea sp.]
MILVDGGYVKDGQYHFFLQGHLGSNRVVARADGTVVQTNHYYPYGTPFAESYSSDIQKYKYIGKEYDTDNGLGWYDVEARMMDGLRFTTMDPLAEKYYSISPYTYCAGNPILFVDPNGLSVHLNRWGEIVQENDDGDDGIYTHDDLSNWDNSSTLGKSGMGIRYIGDIGGTVNIDYVFSNLLEQNMNYAAVNNRRNLLSLPVAMVDFIFKVWTGGEWDLKNNEKYIYNRFLKETSYSFQGKLMEAEDVGNLHFGAVALAFGLFEEDFVLRNAGNYQIWSDTSQPEWQKYSSHVTMTMQSSAGAFLYTQRIRLSPYGDDPRDQKWIQEGFSYFKQYGK